MRKVGEKERVLARVLAEELKQVQGGDDPVYVTQGPRRDITDANSSDKPPD